MPFNHGEVLHPAGELLIRGTSTFTSGETKEDKDKDQGTFTDYACLRYGLIGSSGVANERSARLSRAIDRLGVWSELLPSQYDSVWGVDSRSGA